MGQVLIPPPKFFGGEGIPKEHLPPDTLCTRSLGVAPAGKVEGADPGLRSRLPFSPVGVLLGQVLEPLLQDDRVGGKMVEGDVTAAQVLAVVPRGATGHHTIFSANHVFSYLKK